jgi:hypothetical protein
VERLRIESVRENWYVRTSDTKQVRSEKVVELSGIKFGQFLDARWRKFILTSYEGCVDCFIMVLNFAPKSYFSASRFE